MLSRDSVHQPYSSYDSSIPVRQLLPTPPAKYPSAIELCETESAHIPDPRTTILYSLGDGQSQYSQSTHDGRMYLGAIRSVQYQILASSSRCPCIQRGQAAIANAVAPSGEESVRQTGPEDGWSRFSSPGPVSMT